MSVANGGGGALLRKRDYPGEAAEHAAGLEAAARWDAWFDSACATADGLLGRSVAASVPTEPSTVSAL